MDKKQINQLLKKMLEDYLDDCLKLSGFKRNKNSMKYSRNIGEIEQNIEMVIFINPRYSKDAYVHIYPYISLNIPSVNEIALNIVGDANLLPNKLNFTIRQPIDTTAPKEFHERWYVTGEDSFAVLGDKIRHYFEKWVIKFLEDYSSIEGVINNFENGDNRVFRQDSWFIYIAACYLAQERVNEAYNVLNQRFKALGLRSKYEKSLENTKQYCINK